MVICGFYQHFIFIISYIIIKCIKINEIYILFFLLLLSMVSSAFPSIFYISLIVKYLCYFYFGFVVAKSNLSFVCKDRIILVTLFVFFSIFSIFFIKNSINYIIQPICGCLGTLSVYSICNNNKYNTLLNIIETNSFTIYLLHPPIVYIIFNEFANIKPILLVTLAIILSIIIPIFIAKILIKCNLSYLIGEK